MHQPSMSGAKSSIQQWLEQSRSVRQSRFDRLNEFENFVDAQSSSCSIDIQSPFHQKYEFAQSQLQELEQQINEFRVSSPPQTLTANTLDTFTVNHAPTPSTIRSTITKSQSESVLFNNTNPSSHTILSPKSPLNRSSRSRSEQILSPKHRAIHSSATPSVSNGPLSPPQRLRRHLLSNLESQSDLHFDDKSTSISRRPSIPNLDLNSRSKSRRKSPRKLSVQFIDDLSPRKSVNSVNPHRDSHRDSHRDLHRSPNPIDRVRCSLSIQNEHETGDWNGSNAVTPSILSSPRSPLRSPMRSPLRSPRSINSPIFSTRNSIRSPIRSPQKSFNFGADSASESLCISKKSTVFEAMEDAERSMVDKESNIDLYRQSVLVQLDEAEHKRQSVMEQRHRDSVAIRFWAKMLKQKVMAQWRDYAENEVMVWKEQREFVVIRLCWNRWREMYGAICTVQRRRYLRLWRDSNLEHHRRIQKLLTMPTKSRHCVLTLISVLRLCRQSMSKKRSRIILNRLFSRHRLIVIFVLFTTWRTFAEQQNMAAFRVIEFLQNVDRTQRIRTIRIWRAKTRMNRVNRQRVCVNARKLHRRQIMMQYFKRWKVLFVHEATTKMALFHWAKTMEIQAFLRWRYFTDWSIRAQCTADRVWRSNIVRKWFVFWVNEMVRVRNERQWMEWRQHNRSVTMHQNDGNDKFKPMMITETKQTAIYREQRGRGLNENRNLKMNKKVSAKINDTMNPRANAKGINIPMESDYLSTVRSVDTESMNLFFPYYGESGKVEHPKVDLERISSEPNEDRLSYVKHCELESILIPICSASTN